MFKIKTKQLVPQEAVTEILTEIGKIVSLRAAELAPIDTGALRRSIHYNVEGNSVFIICDVPYASDMEYGTPPSILGTDERKDLAEWAKRHNIPAFPVIRKIEKEGIKVGTVDNPLKTEGGTYRPFMRPAVHQSQSDIKKTMIGVLKARGIK